MLGTRNQEKENSSKAATIIIIIIVVAVWGGTIFLSRMDMEKKLAPRNSEIHTRF